MDQDNSIEKKLKKINADEFTGCRAGPGTFPLRRKQFSVLAFHQRAMKLQDRGGFQNNGGAKQASRAHEPATQAGDESVNRMQIWRPLTRSVQDLQLMPQEHALGNHGSYAAWSHQADDCYDQVDEKD